MFPNEYLFSSKTSFKGFLFSFCLTLLEKSSVIVNIFSNLHCLGEKRKLAYC